MSASYCLRQRCEDLFSCFSKQFSFSELVEHNDELQTQLLNRQVKEGRNLLAEQQENMTAEMGNMTEEQVSVKTGKH